MPRTLIVWITLSELAQPILPRHTPFYSGKTLYFSSRIDTVHSRDWRETPGGEWSRPSGFWGAIITVPLAVGAAIWCEVSFLLPTLYPSHNSSTHENNQNSFQINILVSNK